ncbi:GNAT family N-acetyltransferase [Chitinibacter tainanensis]|uniref:GNAT family N-acetyltransferase n=1 Tax=Chitinibacter tainanensis TaxID=230667 RepID=UPI0004216F39|nr:GNAT family N-acetyltransferase [Chitinibacter tainanensis]
MDLQWQWRRWPEFDSLTLYHYLQLRQAVFVVEQACAYPDLDALDLSADHLLGWDGEQLAACLRLVPPGEKFAEPSLGRVVVAPAWRGTGAGHALIAEGLRFAAQRYPGQGNRIGAQAHLQGFYGRHGFVTISALYDEDGIEHVDMLRESEAMKS